MSTDKLRYTVKFTDEVYKERLKVLAKRFKISQGEAIEVMLDMLGDDTLAFAKKRESKVEARTSIRSIIQRSRADKQKAQAHEC